MSAVTLRAIMSSILSTSVSSSGVTAPTPALLTSMVMLGSSRSVASTLARSALLLRSARSTLTDRPVSLVRRAESDFSRASFRATRMRS